MQIDLASFAIGLCAAPLITLVAWYVVYGVLDSEKIADSGEIVQIASVSKKPEQPAQQPINVNVAIDVEPIMDELRLISQSNNKQYTELLGIRKTTDAWRKSALYTNAMTSSHD